MANQHTDNFEFYGTSNLPGPSTAALSGANVAVSGGKLRISNNGGILISDGITAQGTWFCNIRINITNLPGGSNSGYPANCWPIVTFYDASNLQCGLYVRSDGKLQFFRGTTAIGPATLLAIDFDADTTYYDLELKIVFHGSAGSVELRINGATEISASSLDTIETANASADSFIIGQNGSGASSILVGANVDHVIFFDSTGSAPMNTFLGPVTVYWNTVTADGTNTGWAVTGAGSRFQAVDDSTPNGDTDYVAAATPGTKVSFALSDLPAAVTAVKGVFLWLNQKRDDSTTRGDKALVRVGGTDYLGATEIFLNTNYIYQKQAFDLSPDTSAQWTVVEVNGAEAGAQVTT